MEQSLPLTFEQISGVYEMEDGRWWVRFQAELSDGTMITFVHDFDEDPMCAATLGASEPWT